MKLPANGLQKATDFLGIKVIQGSDFIALARKQQIQSLLDEVGHGECRNISVRCETSVDLGTVDGSPANASLPYRRVVAVLLYIATHTRPDLAVVTKMLPQHVGSPSKKHQAAEVKVIKYHRSISRHGLVLKPTASTTVTSLFHSNWTSKPEAGREARRDVVIY